jgi:hypothetical protein
MEESVIHGPFHKFEEMMEDAFKRDPHLQDTFLAIAANSVYALLDDDEDIADWTIINGLAKEGMVISVHPDDFDGHAWSYELDDEP